MSLSAISTSGIIMGSGSVAISGELYVRASQIDGGIPASTVTVLSTPSQISVGNVENYAMNGSMIRLSTSVATGCSIGGIDAYGYYSDKLLINVYPSGSGSITLKHESTNSLAYNRLSLPGGSGMIIHPYLSPSGYMIRVIYDPVGLRWKASIGPKVPMYSPPFIMRMVTVGNPGNAADTMLDEFGGGPYGVVSYSYQIGKYEVTGSQYATFLNAVGSTDTYDLYNASMETNQYAAQIIRSGSSGSYTYAVLNNTDNRPITPVTLWNCARFANWMSNGQPSGAQTSTTTEDGAYALNGATTGNFVALNVTNPNTNFAPTFRIPTQNEWYKAAYYSPNYGGAGVGGYYLHATQSDTTPGTTIGSSANQANWSGANGNTATDVGSFSSSESFYGTFDQTGNVKEWNTQPGFRGGAVISSASTIRSTTRDFAEGDYSNLTVGFRIAGPE